MKDNSKTSTKVVSDVEVKQININLENGDVSVSVDMQDGQEAEAMMSAHAALIESGILPDPEAKAISPFEQVKICQLDPRELTGGEEPVEIGSPSHCSGCGELVIAGYLHPRSGAEPFVALCGALCFTIEWFIDGVCVGCGGVDYF